MISATAATRSDAGPPDLRLAAVALGTWLSAYAALHTRAPVALAVAAAAAGGVAGAWRWVGRTDRGAGAWAGVVVALLLGVVCGSVATAARLAARDADPVAGLARDHATVTVQLTVRRDPRLLDRDGARPPTWLVPARLNLIRQGGEDTAGAGPTGHRVRARILVLAGEQRWQALRPGHRVRATGRLAPPRGGDLTAAVLSADGVPELVGDPPLAQRVAGALRAGLQEASAPLPAEPGGLVPGLAVGDVSNLDPGLSDDFFVTGMTHLVAVSGLIALESW